MKRFNPKHNTSAKNSSSSKNDIVHSADKIKTLSSLWQENKQNILRKIYQILRRHRFWIRVIISLCCVVGFLTLSSLSYKTGFHQGVEQWSELTSRLHQFKQLQEVTLKENLQLKKQLSGLEQQHTIREIEYQKLSSEMKDLLNKNAELREDNALYQSVMGKPSSKNGLGIQRLQLYATQSPNIFHDHFFLDNF